MILQNRSADFERLDEEEKSESAINMVRKVKRLKGRKDYDKAADDNSLDQ